MASWLVAWWSWTLPSVLQATLLLGLAWMADRLLVRRVWPQILMLLWLLALGRSFLPPGLTSPLSVTSALGGPTLAAAELAPGALALNACFVLWLGGFLACVALRLLRRAHFLARIELVTPSSGWSCALERAARRLGSRKRPRIGTLDALATPAVIGPARARLLLPRTWLERAPTRRDEHALLHELAHLERRDLWLDELCALLRAALWFHPLAWIAARRLHALSELLCDQTVARALGREAGSYRDTLVLAARELASAPAHGLRGFLGRPSAIVERIERFDTARLHSLSLVRGLSGAFVLVVAACVLPMAPRAADLRDLALEVFAAEESGELQSCFSLQAAALVLAADASSPTSDP